MNDVPRHKVFVSFYHDDQRYKDSFAAMMEGNIVDKSVEDGDIDDTMLSTDTIRQKIRDGFIRDATVTVVLIGPCTWQRKHVDWEIGSSLRDTQSNPRCGLLGILLPNHANYCSAQRNLRLMPPRLADNCQEGDSFSSIYSWSYSSALVKKWIHAAFMHKSGRLPNNSRQQFRHNRSGDCLKGWS